MILEIAAMIFVGRSFYQLAENHRKNRWLFTILGIVSFYFGIFVGGIVLALVYELYLHESIEGENPILLTLMALPLGIFSCWGLYKILSNQWLKKSSEKQDSDVLDASIFDRDLKDRN